MYLGVTLNTGEGCHSAPRVLLRPVTGLLLQSPSIIFSFFLLRLDIMGKSYINLFV